MTVLHRCCSVLLCSCLVLVAIPPSRIWVEPSPTHHDYIFRDETVVYRGWRTVSKRTVHLPNNRTATFDIIGNHNAKSAALIFAWNSTSKTCTLLREYHPGCHRILYGLAAGLVEDDKHDGNASLAAHHELEEECHLAGGTWYSLTPVRPLIMDKYASTTAYCFLVVDPIHVTDPKPLDDEEDIEIVRGVTIQELLKLISRGEFNCVGAWAALLALQKLREMGEVD